MSAKGWANTLEIINRISNHLFRKKGRSASSTSRSEKIPKTEPLSPLAGASDFAYASDIAENNVCKPGHVVELSF
jgi:hypothetical protein